MKFRIIIILIIKNPFSLENLMHLNINKDITYYLEPNLLFA